uniref:Uncharacterized protein TCIL3000_11_7560 n=1 Tax=Trypanosoma congolense (strain IL3000) TaxID=1068625 RepID=G0V0Z9_TRYCI|nr:unnamed protein product [Trypanosoma congolense IL3000]
MSWVRIIDRQVVHRNASEMEPMEQVFHAHTLAQNQLLRLQQRLQKLTGDNAKLDEQNKELLQQIHTLELTSAGVISRAGREEKLEAKIGELQQQLQESLENEKDYYKNACEVKRLTDENTTLRNEIAQLKDRETQREDVLLMLRSEYAALKQENDTVRPKLNTAMNERDRCVKELISAKEAMACMQEEMMGYMDELNTLRKKAAGGGSVEKTPESRREISHSSQHRDPYSTCTHEASVVDVSRVPSKILCTIQHTHGERPIYALCAAEGGKRIITGGGDRMLRHWGSDNGAVLHSHTSVDVPLCLDSVSNYLIVGCADGAARMWNTQTQRKTELTGHSEKVVAAYLSETAANAYTASSDRTIRLWDARQGVSQRTLINPSACNDLCALESLIFSAHYNGSICVWDVRAPRGGQREIKCVHREGATCVRVCEERSCCVSLGRTGAISVRDTRAVEKELFRVEHNDMGTSTYLARFALSPGGNFCAVGNMCGSVRIVDLVAGRSLNRELRGGHLNGVKGVLWTQVGESVVLATIGDDRRLVLWN